MLYGATGYIGGLIARAMVAGGARPVLAGRDQGRLDALAVEEVQDRAKDDAYRFGRVDDSPQVMVGQHRGGIAQVRRDRGHTGVGEQRAGVRQHHRVQVDVGHPGSGQDRLRGLMNCGGSGQPGAQVDELADSLGGGPGDSLGDERPVLLDHLGQRRVDLQQQVGLGPVRGEMVLAAQ